MSEYLVNVNVLAVAGLTLPGDSTTSPDPSVTVTIFGEERSTEVLNDVSTAAFNHLVSISKRMTAEDFEGEDVVVAVYHRRYSIGIYDKLGQVVLSLAKVYSYSGHSVPKDWYMLVLPESPGEGRGYVQLSVGAYGPGDIVARTGGQGGADEASENQPLQARVWKLPLSNAAKSLYQLKVTIYSGQALRSVASLLGESCDPFVQVDFNGTSQRTQTHRGNNMPNFNEEIQVPFVVPAWDNSVNVKLLSDGGLTGSTVELGEVVLDIDELTEASVPPTWHYFYLAPADAGKGADASSFAGRLLLSAEMSRSEKPLLTVIPSSLARPPPVDASLLWADLYMVVFDSLQQPEETWVTVELPTIVQEELTSTKPVEKPCGHVWDDDGRLESVGFVAPDPSMCGDVIVSVHARFGGGGTLTAIRGAPPTRYMYCRIPACDVSNFNPKPVWHDMRLVYGSGGEEVGAAGFILLSINLGKADAAPPRRPKRQQIVFRNYMFRACIYQAVNLPAKDEEGTSDPVLAINFGAATMRTRGLISQCINPSWNEILEVGVQLPETQTLRPDVLITLLDSDEGTFEPLVQLRYKTGEGNALPRKWRGSPRWFQLQPVPGGVATKGKLLASFELEPLDDDEELPPFESRTMDYETVKCRIDFFAIGARIKAESEIDINSALLEIAWGRKEDDRAQPKRKKVTGLVDMYQYRCNWLETKSLKVKLAKDPQFQEYLEIRLLGDSKKDDDGAVHVRAHATVHLAQYLPWVRKEERDRYKKLFEGHDKPAYAEETDKDDGKGTENAAEDNVSGAALWQRYQDAARNNDKQLAQLIGWDVDSIEASNARLLGIDEFAVTKDEEDIDNVNFLREQLQELEAHDDEVDKTEFHEALLNFNRGFTWPVETGDSEGLDRHPDHDAVLEQSLDPSELPYCSTMFFLGSEFGELRNLGTLKFCVRVVELDRDDGKETTCPDREWEEKLQHIKDGFADAHGLVVRAYVLGAVGLLPPSGSPFITSYIWSRADGLGEEQHPAFNLRDNLTKREHTLDPQFNKCHAFSNMRFPENSTLSLGVLEVVPGSLVSAEKDEVIGCTEIDLEDRWFHQRYQALVDQDIVPIESRPLQIAGSIFGKGHLRLWVDILSQQRSQDRQLVSLPSTEPLPFVLRVVVWKVVDIDADSPNLKASGRHTLDNGDALYEETDTHFGVDDEKATFNWRLIFNVMIPCKDARLLVQIWHDNLLADDQILAEVTLDLGRDFFTARTQNRVVELPRGLLKMYHSSSSDVRAQIDMEAMLLPADEAVMRPAGNGRDDPNQDPFCDGTDPHLVSHRSRIGNLAIVKNLKAIAGAALFAGQLALIGKILAAVGSAIFGVVFLIIQANNR